MHPQILIGMAVAVITVNVNAQTSSYTGSYTATTQMGTFTLTLTQDPQGRVTGSLVGGQLNAQVQGMVRGAAAEGTLVAPMGQSFFRVEQAGDQLLLTIVDPDVYGQPDFSTQQQFPFRRSPAASEGPHLPPAAPPPPATPAEPPRLTSGEIDDPSWGFSFQVPDGWQHQKTAEIVVMYSTTENGRIYVMPHAYSSLSELQAEAQRGISEQGTQLVLAGAVAPFGDHGLAAEYQGVADGQMARAFAVGLLSPHGGGATVLTAVASDSYSAAYAERVKAIAHSLRFRKPEAGPVVAQWRQKLAGHCVAYLSSYSSSGGSYGGYSTGGYMSSKSRLYLYPDGRFEGGSSNSISIDTGGAFGSGGGSTGPQSGRWEVVPAPGGAALRIRHADGSISTYQLSTNEKGNTLLDGERWFVVSYQECNDL